MAVKTHLLKTESGDLSYSIERSRRRTMSIIIRRDGTVAARVPLQTSDRSVEAFITSKAGWVLKHTERILSRHIGHKKSYTDGEIHPYLGRDITLRIVECGRNRVSFDGETLLIERAGPWDPSMGEALVNSMYRKMALPVFTERMDFILDKFSHYRFKPSSLKVRTTISRWGSCSATGSITLSSNLIKKREELIDYVILHELCHLFHRNHGDGFYKLLLEVCPGYRELRNELKGDM
jgi:predicted metal-dependent hydrolase